MKKIGILYICTGDYNLFWPRFYETSELFLLHDFEKHYFVFTDNPDKIENLPRIHLTTINNLPWPLITLMRFHYFLMIEPQLREMDYLMFSNANLKFVTPITEAEFLPRKDKGEDLFVVTHPGYAADKVYHAPFERNVKSKAYVPYNCGKKYVIGALNGGTSDAFLRMVKILHTKTNEDLKRNYIPRWHDESMLNFYIAGYSNYRLLHPAYCYPYGMSVKYAPKIATVGKEEVFDVKAFKGTDKDYKDNLPKIVVWLGKKAKRAGRGVLYLRDCILKKHIRERFDNNG